MKKVFFVMMLMMVAVATLLAQPVDETVPNTLAPKKLPTVTPADSAKPCYWKYSGLYTFTTTQTGYYHWADGGENSFSLNAFGNFASTYNKGRWMFDNYLTVAYGKSLYADNDMKITDLKKIDDKIDLSLTGGYKMDRSRQDWYYSAMFTFFSQFDDGFDYGSPIKDESGDNILDKRGLRTYPLKSSFLSPATMNLAFGATYIYKERLTILLSPFAGKLVVVADDRLTYKDKVVGYDTLGVAILESKSTAGVEAGKHSKWGAGLLAEIRWKRPLNKAETIDIDSKLRISNNYLDKNKDNRWNFDVYGQLGLNFTISKVFSASFRLETIYDHEIDITYKRGEEIKTGPSLQLKEIIGFGLSYKLVQKK